MECASLWASVSLPDMAVAQIQSQKYLVATATSKGSSELLKPSCQTEASHRSALGGRF